MEPARLSHSFFVFSPYHSLTILSFHSRKSVKEPFLRSHTLSLPNHLNDAFKLKELSRLLTPYHPLINTTFHSRNTDKPLKVDSLKELRTLSMNSVSLFIVKEPYHSLIIKDFHSRNSKTPSSFFLCSPYHTLIINAFFSQGTRKDDSLKGTRLTHSRNSLSQGCSHPITP